MPAMAKKLHIAQEKRLNQIEKDSREFPINRIEMNDKKIGIITSGICYQYVKEALPQASVLKMGIINPLPKDLIREAFTGETPEHVPAQPAPGRPPLMCAGCPHRGLFYILGCFLYTSTVLFRLETSIPTALMFIKMSLLV